MNVVRLIDWVCANWRQPDEGIWEVRGGRKEFLYSRVMCWVAIDRAIRLARKRSFPAPMARWHEVRDTIYHDIFARFWDADAEGLRAARGAQHARRAVAADAARALHLADRSALAVHAARHRARPGRAIRSSTATELANGFSDGLTGQEGTFSMCSFWYVECLSRLGDLAEGALLLREDAGLRQPPRPLRRGARARRRSTSATSRRRSPTWR